MAKRGDHSDRADESAVGHRLQFDSVLSDWEDERWDRAGPYEEFHLFRNFFGIACLLAVFLLFLMMIEPGIAAWLTSGS